MFQLRPARGHPGTRRVLWPCCELCHPQQFGFHGLHPTKAELGAGAGVASGGSPTSKPMLRLRREGHLEGGTAELGDLASLPQDHPDSITPSPASFPGRPRDGAACAHRQTWDEDEANDKPCVQTFRRPSPCICMTLRVSASLNLVPGEPHLPHPYFRPGSLASLTFPIHSSAPRPRLTLGWGMWVQG